MKTMIIPITDYSLVDSILELERNTIVEKNNKNFKENINEKLYYTESPIVSSDTISSHCGAAIDSRLTDLIEVYLCY